MNNKINLNNSNDTDYLYIFILCFTVCITL